MTFTMIFGVIYMTIPLTIVSASFVEITKQHKAADRAIQRLMIHQSEEHQKRSRLFSHIVLTKHHEVSALARFRAPCSLLSTIFL